MIQTIIGRLDCRSSRPNVIADLGMHSGAGDIYQARYGLVYEKALLTSES
jgi:hypothetical protein